MPVSVAAIQRRMINNPGVQEDQGKTTGQIIGAGIGTTVGAIAGGPSGALAGAAGGSSLGGMIGGMTDNSKAPSSRVETMPAPVEKSSTQNRMAQIQELPINQIGSAIQALGRINDPQLNKLVMQPLFEGYQRAYSQQSSPNQAVA